METLYLLCIKELLLGEVIQSSQILTFEGSSNRVRNKVEYSLMYFQPSSINGKTGREKLISHSCACLCFCLANPMTCKEKQRRNHSSLIHTYLLGTRQKSHDSHFLLSSSTPHQIANISLGRKSTQVLLKQIHSISNIMTMPWIYTIAFFSQRRHRYHPSTVVIWGIL